MSTHFNKLTPAEAERLAVLVEELGEAAHAVGKILRHGYESRNPLDINSLSNREMLESELGDVRYAMSALFEAGDISAKRTREWAAAKRERISPYLHHNNIEVSA